MSTEPDATPEQTLAMPVVTDTEVVESVPETEVLEPLPASPFAGASETGLMRADSPAPADEPVPAPSPAADEDPKPPRAVIFEGLGSPGIFPCFHCGTEYADPAAADDDRFLDSLRRSAIAAGWDSDSLGEWSCPACLPAHIAPSLTLDVLSPAAAYRLMHDAWTAAGRYEDIDAMFDAPERRAERGFDKAARHATSALAGARRDIAILAADYQHARETEAA